MRNHTPYIYILIFIGINLGMYSQDKKTLVIQGSNPNSDLIIQKIGYQKEIAHDSLYRKEIKKLIEKLEYTGFINNEIDSIYKNDSIYYVKLRLNNSIKKVQIRHPIMSKFGREYGYYLKDTTTVELDFQDTVEFFKGLVSYYQDNGHPFVVINVSEIQIREYNLYIDLSIHPHKKRNIDKIVIKGYSNFPKSFIDHIYNIRVDETFDKSKISEISGIIQATPFVSEIKKPEFLFTKDSTSLFLYLKREKSNYFDGLIGFSTTSETQKIQLYGNVDLKIQNALNQGELLQLNWIASQNQSQTLKLNLEAPYIFNTPLLVGYDFSIHKQDSTFITTANLLKTDYQLNSKNKVGFFLETKKSSNLGVQAPLNTINFSSFFYGVSFTLDKANYHPIFNKKLYLNSLLSQGKRDGNKQNKITNFFQYLIPISERQNILIKNTTEILISDTFLDNELFRVGGSASIRGFDENTFYANSYSYINTEYNYLMGSTSYLSALADVGLLENKIDDTIISTYSFGLGFTQKTKIGLLGIQYFIGNTDKNSFSFNNSKLHLKISQSF